MHRSFLALTILFLFSGSMVSAETNLVEQSKTPSVVISISMNGGEKLIYHSEGKIHEWYIAGKASDSQIKDLINSTKPIASKTITTQAVQIIPPKQQIVSQGVIPQRPFVQQYPVQQPGYRITQHTIAQTVVMPNTSLVVRGREQGLIPTHVPEMVQRGITNGRVLVNTNCSTTG